MSAPAMRRPAPLPIDMAAEPHLRGAFAPQVREVDTPDLIVEGKLPAEIEGDYLRNGPNPRFSPLGGYVYPLDGDGMLHRVQFRDGQARYTNRFVRTPAVVAEEAAGRALWPGISDFGYTPGADVVGSELAHTVKDLPGINVVRHGGRLLALAESAPPFGISPDLDTLDRSSRSGGRGRTVTAPVVGAISSLAVGTGGAAIGLVVSGVATVLCFLAADAPFARAGVATTS
jgi:carotenoid cleavage dioxygenase-like enzyme